MNPLVETWSDFMDNTARMVRTCEGASYDPASNQAQHLEMARQHVKAAAYYFNRLWINERDNMTTNPRDEKEFPIPASEIVDRQARLVSDLRKEYRDKGRGFEKEFKNIRIPDCPIGRPPKPLKVDNDMISEDYMEDEDQAPELQAEPDVTLVTALTQARMGREDHAEDVDVKVSSWGSTTELLVTVLFNDQREGQPPTDLRDFMKVTEYKVRGQMHRITGVWRP